VARFINSSTSDTDCIYDVLKQIRFSLYNSHFDSHSTNIPLQINKKEADGKGLKGKFNNADKVLVENLASHIGVVLRNAHLYEVQEAAKNKMEGLGR
jgi:hypothetical protein